MLSVLFAIALGVGVYFFATQNTNAQSQEVAELKAEKTDKEDELEDVQADLKTAEKEEKDSEDKLKDAKKTKKKEQTKLDTANTELTEQQTAYANNEGSAITNTQAAAQAAGQEYPLTYVVSADSVSVRRTPSTSNDSNIVNTLSSGTAFNVNYSYTYSGSYWVHTSDGYWICGRDSNGTYLKEQ